MAGHVDLLIEATIEQYRTVLRAYQSATAREWLGLELSMAQLKTLFTVARVTEGTVGEIAEMLDVGLSTASHLVDRLVQAGLVARSVDPGDRRRTLVSLTPEGRELVTRLRQGSHEHLKASLAAMSERDLNALLQGLTALAEASTNHVEVPGD